MGSSRSSRASRSHRSSRRYCHTWSAQWRSNTRASCPLGRGSIQIAMDPRMGSNSDGVLTSSRRARHRRKLYALIRLRARNVVAASPLSSNCPRILRDALPHTAAALILHRSGRKTEGHFPDPYNSGKYASCLPVADRKLISLHDKISALPVLVGVCCSGDQLKYFFISSIRF